MVERKVGERFFVGRTQLKVVLDKPNEYCRNCYFWYKNSKSGVQCSKPLDVAGSCVDDSRTDKVCVHFEEV